MNPDEWQFWAYTGLVLVIGATLAAWAVCIMAVAGKQEPKPDAECDAFNAGYAAGLAAKEDA